MCCDPSGIAHLWSNADPGRSCEMHRFKSTNNARSGTPVRGASRVTAPDGCVRALPVRLATPAGWRRRACFALLPLAFSLFTTGVMRAQNRPAGQRESQFGAFLTLGGGNTQFPLYADNALGVSMGLFYQRKLLLGAEVRGGTSVLGARYNLSPVTAGYRIARHSEEGGSDLGWSPLSIEHWAPFGYFGGGYSYAQDSGTFYQNPPSPTHWVPCWQAIVGVDRSYRFASWRMVEVSWTKTYTDLHDLRTPSVSTGVVFHLGR